MTRHRPPSLAADLYAVIGQPIAHSKSPLIHRLFAQATGQRMHYTALEAPVDGFANAVRAFRESGGQGLNVTLPFKLQAFALATHALDSARLAGAANALKFEDSRIYAQNFDGAGLVHDIEHNLGVSLHGQRVLICGAGGATRGAILPIALRRPALMVLANRDADKAQRLAHDFAPQVKLQTARYEALATMAFDVVINATSTGLLGANLPLPAGVFSPGALAYEMVYGQGLTPFLRQAQSMGAARLADGVGMLVEQAALAFEWWRGVRPDTGPVIEQLSVALV